MKVFPLFASPMAGYTDTVYRKFARKFGAGMVFTEMVSAEGVIFSTRLTKKYLQFCEEEIPIGAQLFTANPSVMEKAAKIVAQMFPSFSVIDINMGCPVRKVVRSGSGAALLCNHTLACDIVRSAQQAGMPVSVKLRKGFRPGNENNTIELIHKIAELGVSFITVHPRTADQMYSGKADWEFLDKVARTIGIPVVGSGDIFDVSDAQRMLADTSVAGVAVARGAIGSFFIFSQIRSVMVGENFPVPVTVRDKADVLLQFLEEEVTYRGEERATRWARKFLVGLSKSIPNGAKLRKNLSTIDTLKSIEKWLEEVVIEAERHSNSQTGVLHCDRPQVET